MAQPLPVLARRAVSVRVATMADLPFLDQLQKQHSKQLGFFPRAQMEGYVSHEWVLIAEDAATREPLGYCASRDRYLKRDELGVVYQLCVAPGHQRGLIGATLIRDVFARAAYGCRLFCCWCAQDLDANYFWESLGFVPIAFRGGSGKRKRVHIFWQRRIREGDATTPWWFPAKTDQGAMREDRIVFPIPPGVRWQDVEAVEIPPARDLGILPEPKGVEKKSAGGTPKPREAKSPAPVKRAVIARTARLRFVVAPAPAPEPASGTAQREKKVREKKPAAKVDPKYLAAARELRDRYLEQVNGERANDLLRFPSRGKYDVARAIPSATRLNPSKSLRDERAAIPQLPAA